MKVAVLISGRGSNMENLIKASQLSNNRIQIVQVLSNRKDAPGIKVAQQLGVATEIIENSASTTSTDLLVQVVTQLSTKREKN